MDRIERKEAVITLRNQDIIGRFVILRPVSAKYAVEIVTLRNKPRNLYCLNQPGIVSLEDQLRWIEKYEKKTDDIYWCILDKKERFIGTIRIYDIDMDGMQCEEGSYVVDEDVSGEAPYAIESKMLALDAAFDTLDIGRVKNENRADNKGMNNMDNQLGFDQGENTLIRGTSYLIRFLSAKDYRLNRSKFSSVIDYWSER